MRFAVDRRVPSLLVAFVLCALAGLLAFWSAPALAAAPEIPELTVEAHVPSPPSPSTEAVLHGVLNPNAIALSEAGSYEFLYKAGATCAGGTPAPIPPGLELGVEREPVSETLSGLTANTEYTVCLREETTGGEALSPAVTFKTALPPEAPETINPANPIAATTATLHGVLNPKAAGNPGFYEFLYGASATECEGGEPPSGGIATGTMAEKVEAKLTGLLPSTTYTFCLLARNEAGETALSSPPVTFSTLSAPPVIAGASFPYVASTEAKLTAQIDPEGSPVSYHVEYGTSEAYGQSTPEVSLPAGQAAVGVEVWLSKLEPGSVYHFRFVATNSSHETTQDKDQVFTTRPAARPAGSEHCPNEQLRAEQGDQHLPDCRAYEQVTPSEKGATQDLTFESAETAAVARSGERVALHSVVGFYGANPSAWGTSAVFSRTPSEWRMTSVQPPGAGETVYAFNIANPELTLIGADATTNMSLVSHSPEQSLSVGPVGGPYANLATTPYGGLFAPKLEGVAGASGDFGHVVLSSYDHSLPSLSGPERTVAEGAVAGAHNLYEWYAATEELRLVNVTSAGALTNSCGATLGGGQGSIEVPPGAANAVSTDGSKIFFTSPDAYPANGGEASCQEPQRIYMRLDGRETVEVSAPEEHVSDPTGLHGAYYEGASEDGSKVWFSSETELTANDTAHAMELYEYNTLTGKLVRVSRGETGTAEGDVEREWLAISADGSTVYFVAQGKLTAGATPGGRKIYRYDTNTGTIALVAGANVDNNGKIPLFTNRTGSALVFQAAGGGGDEIFRYSAADGSVKCVSCPPKGAAVDGGAFFPSIAMKPALSFLNKVDQLRPVSDDGRYVFFESNDGLVPQDTNGIPNAGSNQTRATDTYEWEADGAGSCTQVEGCVSLLSSGTSEFASAFLGASADGSNVFFATHAALVPQDGDALGDIYDARVDGGIPAPQPGAACAGESCRLIGGAAPVFGTPQSVAFYGAGNLPPVPVAKHKAVVKKKSKKKRKSRKKARKSRKASRGPVGARKANGRGR